jgi:hypothetical protein
VVFVIASERTERNDSSASRSINLSPGERDADETRQRDGRRGGDASARCERREEEGAASMLGRRRRDDAARARRRTPRTRRRARSGAPLAGSDVVVPVPEIKQKRHV